MQRRAYQEFEAICAQREICGSVLEIGAIPSPNSLLCMKALDQASEKVGLNLDGPHTYRDFTIHQGNANAMDRFPDKRFDAVLCNAVLEHDKFFWKTLAEIRRVTKPGGLIVIGAPGYDYLRGERVKRLFHNIPFLRSLKSNQYLNLFFKGTVTVEVHNEPGDYYRFSPQAFKEVFLEEMENVEIRSVMVPPRIIGFGTKKATV